MTTLCFPPPPPLSRPDTACAKETGAAKVSKNIICLGFLAKVYASLTPDRLTRVAPRLGCRDQGHPHHDSTMISLLSCLFILLPCETYFSHSLLGFYDIVDLILYVF